MNPGSTRRPPIYRDATPDSLDPALSDVLTRHDTNVILHGPTGTGKTWAAWAGLGTTPPPRSWFVGTTDAAIDTWRGDNRHDTRRTRPETAHILVLDDVGSIPLTAWGQGTLDQIIDTRHTNQRATWITTNLDPFNGGALYEHIGARAWSRLAATAVVIDMNGPDRRFQP